MITKANSLLKLRVHNLNDDTQVNAGGNTNTQKIEPVAGTIEKVAAIHMVIPAIGGASGNQSMAIKLNADATYTFTVAELIGANGGAIYITKSNFVGDTESPSSGPEQLKLILDGMIGNNDYNMSFVYRNDSDVNQTGTRVLQVLTKVYKEVL